MTFTDEQLWAAVRSAGRDGQSFTCATVRDVLGMSSKKRHDLAQFRDRFRAFRLTAGEGVEKVGKSAYRLADFAAEETSEALIEFEVIAIADEEAEEVAAATVPQVAEVSSLEVAPPEVAEQPPAMPYHPAALEASDMGFGEPMVASAADSGELAANHVIFSAWPDAMQPSDEAGVATEAASQLEARSASQQTEAMIEAEVRECVAASEERQPNASESLIAQAEQAVIRTWRDSGHWLGRRFAELFSRTQN